MKNEGKLSVPMIIGGLAVAALLVFIIARTLGGGAGGATVAPNVGGPPEYAKKAQQGIDGAAAGYTPNVPQAGGGGRPSYAQPGGGAPPGPGGR